LCIRYDSYWQTWDRVLHIDNNGVQIVEFSLTPINPTKRDSWVEQVFPIMIRAHRTALRPTDRLFRSVVKNKHSTVFQEVKRTMLREVPIELVHRMLNEDFLSQIDWAKYLEVKALRNGGGIPFSLCKKGAV
jgi:hypothetical protein